MGSNYLWSNALFIYRLYAEKLPESCVSSEYRMRRKLFFVKKQGKTFRVFVKK